MSQNTVPNVGLSLLGDDVLINEARWLYWATDSFSSDKLVVLRIYLVNSSVGKKKAFARRIASGSNYNYKSFAHLPNLYGAITIRSALLCRFPMST